LHIWCAQASEHDSALSHYTTYLLPDELQRARRFRMPKLQTRYIISRGLLRRILSTYLDCSPESVRIACTLQGKPYLPGTQLQFNLSHSRDAILFAVQRVTPVGVDVEYMRDSVDCVSLAKRFFSKQEYRGINRLTGLAQRNAFYTCWTRKEAYLKATGKGLAGLKEAALLEHGVPSAEKGWTIIDLQMPEPGYAGAVAFAGASALIDTLLLTPDVHGA
jgi:4'-phosphopantetheinyl transferase